MKQYKSKWTAEAILQFRTEFTLSQIDLAVMLGTHQQRISEWENGVHSMGRLYTMLMNQIDEKLTRIKSTSPSPRTYRRNVQEVFGITLNGVVL